MGQGVYCILRSTQATAGPKALGLPILSTAIQKARASQFSVLHEVRFGKERNIHKNPHSQKDPDTHPHPPGQVFLSAGLKCLELVPETIAACSWSLSPEEQPQHIVLSFDASQLPAPSHRRAGPFTQTPPSENLLFEHRTARSRSRPDVCVGEVELPKKANRSP